MPESIAIRYTTYKPSAYLTISKLLQTRAMETSADRRRRKLAAICATKGGHTAVAISAELSPQYLDQILKRVLLPKKKDGTQSVRKLGDDAAAAIEAAYGLGTGWFDLDDSDLPKQLKAGPLTTRAIVLLVVEHVAGTAATTRDTIAAILGNAIRNPETANDCATAIEALLSYGKGTMETADLIKPKNGIEPA